MGLGLIGAKSLGPNFGPRDLAPISPKPTGGSEQFHFMRLLISPENYTVLRIQAKEQRPVGLSLNLPVGSSQVPSLALDIGNSRDPVGLGLGRYMLPVPSSWLRHCGRNCKT